MKGRIYLRQGRTGVKFRAQQRAAPPCEVRRLRREGSSGRIQLSFYDGRTLAALRRRFEQIQFTERGTELEEKGVGEKKRVLYCIAALGMHVKETDGARREETRTKKTHK